MFTTSPQHWKDPPNDFSWFGHGDCARCKLGLSKRGLPNIFQTRLFLCREMDAYRHQQIYWNIPRRSKSDAPALNIRIFFGTHSTDIALEIMVLCWKLMYTFMIDVPYPFCLLAVLQSWPTPKWHIHYPCDFKIASSAEFSAPEALPRGPASCGEGSSSKREGVT